MLRAHDDVRRIQYMWAGPVIDAPVLRWLLKFRQGPLPEWGLAVLLVPLAWPFVARVSGVLEFKPLEMVLRFVGTWCLARRAAVEISKRAVNADRPTRYVARCLVSEITRRRWASGPLHPACAVAAVAVWYVGQRVGSTVAPDVPRVVWLVAAAWAATRAVTVVGPWFERFGSSERALELAMARRRRSAPSVAAPLAVSVDVPAFVEAA